MTNGIDAGAGEKKQRDQRLQASRDISLYTQRINVSDMSDGDRHSRLVRQIIIREASR